MDAGAWIIMNNKLSFVIISLSSIYKSLETAFYNQELSNTLLMRNNDLIYKARSENFYFIEVVNSILNLMFNSVNNVNIETDIQVVKYLNTKGLTTDVTFDLVHNIQLVLMDQIAESVSDAVFNNDERYRYTLCNDFDLQICSPYLNIEKE